MGIMLLHDYAQKKPSELKKIFRLEVGSNNYSLNKGSTKVSR